MTRAKNWIGFLAAAALCAGPVAALAQSPLSPTPIESQPLAPPVAAPATPAPVTPAPVTPAPAPAAPAAQAPALQPPAAAVPTPAATQPAAPPAVAPSTADGAPALKPVAKPKPKPAPPPREMALSDDPTPVLQPETFFATAKASERYANIVDAGGWPVVPGALSPGAKGPGVVALRRRLAVEGDLIGAEGAAGASWSPALTAAVKRFQFRNGLKQTGVVAGATLRAINIPANVRFKQLASSAQRLAGMNFTFTDKYVVVNLPSTAVDAIENGVVAHRYVAIVGGPEHPSPQISAKIVAVNLNPTWTVPESIIKNEIIPKMRSQPNYLSRARIKILDSRGNEINPHSVDWISAKAGNFTLRQDSGAGNSLGLIRIAMPNPDAVYMHDTPSRNLFANDYRFLSHGCVRVEGVYDLAAWLLRGAPGAPTGEWTRDAIQSRIATGAREDVKLPKPVPVIWVYMTGWASADGTVHFRDDVYNVDSVGG
jgi:murein L,D-transpeptidase YcbB/YkuD